MSEYNIFSKHFVNPFRLIENFDQNRDTRLSKSEIKDALRTDFIPFGKQIDTNTKNLLNELVKDNFTKYDSVASLTKDTLIVKSGFGFLPKEEIEEQLSRKDIETYFLSQLSEEGVNTVLVDNCELHGRQTSALASLNHNTAETKLLCRPDEEQAVITINSYLETILNSKNDIKYINLSLEAVLK